MKKILALFILSPLLSGDDSNIVECRAENNTSIEQCLRKYAIYTVDDCIQSAITGSMSKDEGVGFCRQLSIEYDLDIYLADRPTEFYDILGIESIGSFRSYGCSVPIDEDGKELNNALITYYEDDVATKKTELSYKAIIHILDEKNYAEINFGSTIYPISENRFFTNYLEEDDRILGGMLDIKNPNPEMKGGTDRGPEGGGWIISKDKNQLNIFAGAYEIEFIGQCNWSDINMENLQ